MNKMRFENGYRYHIFVSVDPVYDLTSEKLTKPFIVIVWLLYKGKMCQVFALISISCLIGLQVLEPFSLGRTYFREFYLIRIKLTRQS